MGQSKGAGSVLSGGVARPCACAGAAADRFAWGYATHRDRILEPMIRARIDGELVERSNAAARRLGLDKRVQFEQRDVLQADVREATVVTLYLLPDMMSELHPRLMRELKPGTRIVAHDFDFGAWKPERTVTLELDEKYGLSGSWTSIIHLWTVPPRARR